MAKETYIATKVWHKSRKEFMTLKPFYVANGAPITIETPMTYKDFKNSNDRHYEGGIYQVENNKLAENSYYDTENTTYDIMHVIGTRNISGSTSVKVDIPDTPSFKELYLMGTKLNHMSIVVPEDNIFYHTERWDELLVEQPLQVEPVIIRNLTMERHVGTTRTPKLFEISKSK